MKSLHIVITSILLLGLLAVSSASVKAQEKIRFAFMTDLHISESSRSIKQLSQCIADINSDKTIEFALISGDITDFGSKKEIMMAKTILDSLQIPWYIVPGNHDAKWSESGCNDFKEIFGYEQFEFETKGWRFVGFPSGPDMRMAPALVPREALVWLSQREAGKKTILVNHYPQDSSVLNYPAVLAYARKAGVRMMMGGHWHNNYKMDYDGVPGVLCRSVISGNDGHYGYTIGEIEDDVLSLCERRLFSSSAVTLPAWCERKLSELGAEPKKDADGLPESYPWMRYDVNDKHPEVKRVWTRAEDSNIATGFALWKKNACYATTSGALVMVSMKDGALVWKSDLPGKVFSTPVVDGQTVVVGCSGGGVYAFDARNGRQLWVAETDGPVLSSPVIMDKKVYVGASDGKFRALNVKDGSAVWTFSDVKGFVECRPYIDGEQIVFGTWENRMYSLDPQTGRLQWEWKREKGSRMYSPAACNPVKAGGKIFFAAPDRKVYALDAKTGKQLKTFEGGREAVGVSQDGRTVYSKSMHNKAYAIDVEAMEKKWEVVSGLGYDISPTDIAEFEGLVYLPTDKGNIITFDAKTGDRVWAHKISLALVNPLVIVKDKDVTKVLVSCMDGAVALLELQK